MCQKVFTMPITENIIIKKLLKYMSDSKKLSSTVSPYIPKENKSKKISI